MTQNKMPNEAQIKEFWEWCGRKNMIFVDGLCLHDDSNGHRTWLDLDLNNLFKYAVPKLLNNNHPIKGQIEASFWNGIGVWYCRISSTAESSSFNYVEGVADTPALALFKAIWEVIHNGE